MAAVTLGLVLAIGWAPLFLFRAEDVRAALAHYAPAERWWVMITPLLISAHMTAACIAVSVSDPIPWWRTVASLGLEVVGIGIWLWGRTQIGPLRVTRLPDEPPRQFQRRGAFGLVRHPLYFGLLLGAAAPAVAAGHAAFALSWIACAAVLAVRAVQEERRLHAQLGAEYQAYCDRVKRLIPYVW